MDYSQPSFYHFSEDSIVLADEAAGLIQEGSSILDICCGCGIVGIEAILKSRQKSVSLTAVELQEEFYEHFEKNVELFIPNLKSQTKLIRSSFAGIGLPEKYDLIVSNPPYFDGRNNRLGPNLQKNICRFFIDGTFDEFIELILRSLSTSGVALFLVRENESYYSHLNRYSKRALLQKVRSDGKTTLFSMSLLDVD